MYPDDKGELIYAGIDVSVAQYIADDMGLSLQVENMAFEYLLTSLGKGDFDMVLAAMEATPDRLENADFSDPYYNDIPPAILVKADKADPVQDAGRFRRQVRGRTGCHHQAGYHRRLHARCQRCLPPVCAGSHQ